jgi:CheY-specific phosphatase CheX
MTSNLENLLETTVPAALSTLLRDWLGFDGPVSKRDSEWDGILRDQLQGDNYLVGGVVILKISALVEFRFADNLLRSLTGGSDTAVFEDVERLDAVAELSNMLAGRLAEGLRANGVELSILHPNEEKAKGLDLENQLFSRNLAWSWISDDHQIGLIIAY